MRFVEKHIDLIAEELRYKIDLYKDFICLLLVVRKMDVKCWKSCVNPPDFQAPASSFVRENDSNFLVI